MGREMLAPAAQTWEDYHGMETTKPSSVGTVELMKIAGVSFRQVDYWTRTGLLQASFEPGLTGPYGASGSGTRRVYGPDEIWIATTTGRLLRAGLMLEPIRQIMDEIRGRDIDELHECTLKVYIEGDVLRWNLGAPEWGTLAHGEWTSTRHTDTTRSPWPWDMPK